MLKMIEVADEKVPDNFSDAEGYSGEGGGRAYPHVKIDQLGHLRSHVVFVIGSSYGLSKDHEVQ